MNMRSSSDQSGVAAETGVLGHQLLGHGAGVGHQGPVGQELGQLEVAPPLLPGPEDGALPPELEVDLGQLEAVGGPLHGRQPGGGLGVSFSDSR